MRRVTQRRLHFMWRYLRGDTPWDSGIVPPEIVTWIDAAEASDATAGRALDLGCGTGTTSIYLAAHGWAVVGVDFAPNAVRRARRAAHQRHLPGTTQFLSADVSRPYLLDHAVAFDLVVDVGCLHGLDSAQRSGYAANVTRLTHPGAAFLLYAFMPGLSRDGRRQIGIDPDGLRALLGASFEVVGYTVGEDVTVPRPSAWYTLRRTEARS